MKSKTKKLLSCLLAVVMLLTAAPLNGLTDLFTVEASAAVSGYNALAAVQWAKAHCGEITSVLFGTRYWDPGTGDCANFVSECIYMGGLNPNTSWNHNGYLAHYGLSSDGSWIRAQQLCDYVVSIGGELIRNPSASQCEPGDLIFYKVKPGATMHHSAIIVDAGNGSVTIAAHSDQQIAYITSNWHLNFANTNTYLVKMHGATCTQQTVRSIDVYKAGGNAVIYHDTYTSSGTVASFLSGEYFHVSQTKTVNGVKWGYTFRYGRYGWVKLSTGTYRGHYETGPINHLMGEWYTKVKPTCSTEGVEERVCSRCGYTETRNTGIGGEHMNVIPATCLSPSYCTACGETLAPALGHDWDAWNYETAPTCLDGGVEKRECFRCGYKETRDVDALGHDYQAAVALPGCTTTGTTTFTCSRCNDTYIGSAEWSGYAAINTSDAKYAEFLDNVNLCRSRVEYRYKTKSTMTKTNTTGTAPSVTGYTLDSTTWVWNDYGSWSGWQDAYVESSDYRKVETRQVDSSTIESYTMHSYCTRDSSSKVRQYRDYSVNGNYSSYGLDSGYGEFDRTITASYSDVQSATQVSSGSFANSSIVGTNETGYNKSSKTAYALPYGSTTILFYIEGTNYAKKTQYRYCDRTKQYTYNYYKWSDWSDWSTTAQTASSTKQVETRTTYSFKQSVLGHNWDDGVVVAPTCLEGGCTLYTCKRCGATMKTNETPALGHDLRDEESEKGWHIISDDGTTKVYRRDCQRHCGYYEIKSESCIFQAVETVAPTCTEDGYTLYSCANHSGEEYKSDIISAYGHECDEQWSVVKAPTCTEKGLEECHCVRYDGGVTCDKVYQREVEAVGHDLVKTDRVNPTCEKDGHIEYYTCKNCNAIFTDEQATNEITDEKDLVLPAVGHNGKNTDGEEVWVTEQEAACGVTGRERLYCQNDCCDVTETCDMCGEEHHQLLDEREIPEITPNYAIVDHKDSTCYEPGYDIYTCLNCVDTDHEHGYTIPYGLAEHTWGEWEVISEPLCIYPGTEKRVCEVCGATEYRDIPAEYDSHDFETIETNPTCTGTGESYEKCTRCGYTEGLEELDAMGHDMVLDEESSYPPTCTEPGLNHYVCTRGDYYYDEWIEPIGHDYVETGHKEATCLEPGYKVYTCQNDSSHTYDEICEDEPALGHEFCEWYTIREANYAQTRIDERDCIRGDKTEYRELPKLDRPVNENDAVDNDKTAVYDEETGELTITLKTSSEAQKLVQQNSYAMPLDIVLVVDQSGSMAKSGKLEALKTAATEFVNIVYDEAVAKNVDHRISIVGFANSSMSANKNNEVLTTLTDKDIRLGTSALTNQVYKDSLMSVNADGKINPHITNAITRISAEGTTRSDQGFELANNVFSNNPIEETDRQRILVFMTDGEPTSTSGYEAGVANDAVKKANISKNTYGAVVYSIGFMEKSDKAVNFLDCVSSNYPDAVNTTSKGEKTADTYYRSADDIAALSEIFKSIATETTEYYTNFKDLTLIDTISDTFTMTSAQETKLREDAMKNLGVQNEDITVTRHENGTTTVEITNITPKQVIEDGKVIYRTEFTFTVSGNEKMNKAGDYHTNEDDSGVSLDGETFASKFSSPTITVSEDHATAIFNVDGEPYQIISVKVGGAVEAPVYTIDTGLKWDVPDGYTISGGSVTFNAESTDAHAHNYQKIVLKEVDCGNDGLVEYLCECGAHYDETVPATGEHHWITSRPTARDDGFECMEFRCSVCGELYESQHLYVFESEQPATGRLADTNVSVTEEIRLGSLEDDTKQPDGDVTIVAAVGDYFNTDTLVNINVYRVEEDGSRTKLSSTYADGVVTFTTDHFCEYVFEAVYKCQKDGSHYDNNEDGCCDDCGYETSGWKVFRCKMCNTYEAHKDIPFIGIIYTIVHTFVHMAQYISYWT